MPSNVKLYNCKFQGYQQKKLMKKINYSINQILYQTFVNQALITQILFKSKDYINLNRIYKMERKNTFF